MRKKRMIIGILGILSYVYFVPLSWGMTTVKLGTLNLSSFATLFIGIDKGFFETENLKVEPILFKAAQPVAVATASGDVDVGAAGMTAGFYNSIAQGMKISLVAGRGREWPGYKLTAILVNPEQWKAGVRDLKDLKGKRIGITQFGSTFHYMLGNVLEQKGMTMNDVKIVPLGSVNSMRDTLISKQIESAFLVQPFVSPLESDQKANVLLWVGDYLRYQLGGIVYGEKFVKNRPAAISFMKGYIRSCRYYYDNALLKKDQKAYQEILNIISKHSGEKPEEIALSLPYNVQNGEIDAAEIQQQLDWWHKHNLVEKKMSSSEVVDLSFWKEALAQLGK
jgi:NitT/TauT family transport system substrate-binding protein